jgi:hypothetical protein
LGFWSTRLSGSHTRFRVSGLRYPGVHNAVTPNFLSLQSPKSDKRFLVRDPTILDELGLTVQIFSEFRESEVHDAANPNLCRLNSRISKNSVSLLSGPTTQLSPLKSATVLPSPKTSGLRVLGFRFLRLSDSLSFPTPDFRIPIYFILRAHSTAVALHHSGAWYVQEGPCHLR